MQFHQSTCKSSSIGNGEREREKEREIRLTRISRERGCEQSTPVQVRSEIRSASTPFANFSAPFCESDAAAADFEEVAAAFPPLLAAAAAFFCAAFFLLASDTIFNLNKNQIINNNANEKKIKSNQITSMNKSKYSIGIRETNLCGGDRRRRRAREGARN